MKGRNLFVLGILAAVLLALAYASNARKHRKTAAASELGKPVFPELQNADTLNSIASLTFVSPQGTVAVARTDEGWVSPAKHGYPVSFDKVRDFVRTLADLKAGQVVPAAERQRQKLNLVAPGGSDTNAAAGAGTLLTAADPNGKPVVSLLVGKEHMRQSSESDSPYGGFGGYPDGRYIEAKGKALLVAASFGDLPRDDKAWLDTDLLNVSSYDIVELSATNAEGQSVRLARSGEAGDLVLTNVTLAADEEVDSGKVSSLSGSLSYLNFTDVADPSLSATNLGFDKATVCWARTKQGKSYTLHVGAKAGDSGDRYVRVSAAYQPPPEPPAVESAPSTNAAVAAEEAKRKEDEAKKRKEEQDKQAAEIGDLNRKVGKWTYIVPSYKVDGMTAARADFIRKKEKPATTNAAPESAITNAPAAEAPKP